MSKYIIHFTSMIVLGIESSCDETGLALYDTEKGLLAHVLHSQITIHKKYGGVVPELASRDHIRHMIPLLQQIFNNSQITRTNIDAIAYTQGPGLAGALLVGASLACALGLSLNKPVLGIHHLEGHLLSSFLTKNSLEFPFIALLISGGHTQLIRVDDIGQYIILGETLDDAVGEAFDKSAKILGLDYPGGPAISYLANFGNPKTYQLPRPMLYTKNFNFSFSGLKTAVLTLVKNHKKQLNKQDKANIARAFIDAIIEILIVKCVNALKYTGIKRLVIAGGVSANLQLREAFNTTAMQQCYQILYPELEFCTDNGAMIAFAGAVRLQRQPKVAKYEYAFNIKPRWSLDDNYLL